MSYRTLTRAALALALPVAAVTSWPAQASTDDSTILDANLRGRSEVATDASNNAIVGDPNGRGSATVFSIDGDATTLCYVLTVAKIEPAAAAHIHKAPVGTNGPVVVTLTPPSDGSSADCVTEGEPGGFADGQTAADIFANPQEYYVNVHTADYPAGAIRGQLG